MLAVVSALYRFPVKSMQGHPVDHLTFEPGGAHGDRRWALLDGASGVLLSAKRHSRLLFAIAHDDHVELPDGSTVALVESAESDAALSAWLDREVHLAHSTPATTVAYEMTFDPPDDDAPFYEIPAPSGSFVDLADVHLVTEATLAECARREPGLDWDVRRFRPNLVVRDSGDAFAEDSWCPGSLTAGTVTLSARQPTVRCAMPLRAQPGLDRQAPMFAALEALHANHLGIYLDVTGAGTVRVGDPVVAATA